jgi:hypothetical protein
VSHNALHKITSGVLQSFVRLLETRIKQIKTKKLRGLSPQAKYTD